jgi:hypothetical protein
MATMSLPITDLTARSERSMPHSAVRTSGNPLIPTLQEALDQAIAA